MPLRIKHICHTGGKLLGQEWGANLIVFLYDESGMPIGMQYRTSSYSSGTWDSYWFERNLHGDVVAIYNNSNTKLASYIYDAWGNHTVTYHNGGGSLTAIVNNPIRYRGYYYDTDLGLYYLQTRYYDSNIGRFINADGVISGTNGSLHGFNLYAYCFNNPILLTDSSGGWPQWGDILRFVDDVVADVKAFDWENENEQSVLDSNYFSAYKKTLVVRTKLPRSGSFGIIFLNRKANRDKNPKDVVRHEYGHTKQLEQLGIINYALCIGIPSWQEWGKYKYYKKPWETTADIYGEVQSRYHYQGEINRGYEYLERSKKIGVLVWLYIE